MKKEDLFKQWEELKSKEEDIDCINHEEIVYFTANERKV